MLRVYHQCLHACCKFVAQHLARPLNLAVQQQRTRDLAVYLMLGKYYCTAGMHHQQLLQCICIICTIQSMIKVGADTILVFSSLCCALYSVYALHSVYALQARRCTVQQGYQISGHAVPGIC